MLIKKKVKTVSSSSFYNSAKRVGLHHHNKMREKYDENNIYSNNLAAHDSGHKPANSAIQVPNSNSKPCKSHAAKNATSSVSSLAPSNGSVPLNNLDKCKLKNKERLLSNWDKVIKKASNDPESLKKLVKQNHEKAVEDSKKLEVKSPSKTSASTATPSQDESKSNSTSLLLKLNNKLHAKVNSSKKSEAKPKVETSPALVLNKKKDSDTDSNIFDKNTEKLINEMLVNAKTAGKQGELVKNLFSYLNNYGDDGFTIKASNNHTPFLRSELMCHNQLSSGSSVDQISDKKPRVVLKKTLIPFIKKSSNNPSSNIDSNQTTSDSVLTASSLASFNGNPKVNPNPKIGVKPPTPTPIIGQNIKANANVKHQKASNFPYYLKCCVDKNPGAGSTIGSRCSAMNLCPKPASQQQASANNTNNNANDQIQNQSQNKWLNTPNKAKEKSAQLDIDQLIQTLEGDGQVEFFKKKLSLYIKSKHIINSTSTIEDYAEKPATASAVGFYKKEIPFEKIAAKNENDTFNIANTTTTNNNNNDLSSANDKENSIENTYNFTITDKTNILNDVDLDSKFLAAATATAVNDASRRGVSQKNAKVSSKIRLDPKP